MRPTLPLAAALIAVVLGGCLGPSGSPAMHDLTLDTAFTFVPGDAKDNATRVDNGSAAIGLTVWVKTRPTAATANRTWESDPGCQEVQDAPPICDDVPDRSAFVVPAPRPTQDGREASAAYPLGDDGGIVLKAPEPLRLDLVIQGRYGPPLEEQMRDPTGCDEPSGSTHRLRNLTGDATPVMQEPRPAILLRGDADALLGWHGWCADDAF